MKYFKILTIVIFFNTFLISCGAPEAKVPDEDNLVTDMLGRKVKVPTQVNRIIGLRAGALRLLAYMDATAMVCGVEDPEKNAERPYLSACPELKALPSVGPLMGGDAELIISARPDVIFMTYTTVEEADKLQNKVNIPVLALECSDLGFDNKTLFASLQLIGKVTHKMERAEQLINFIAETIAEMDIWTANRAYLEIPGVYVGGLSYSGAYGITSTHHNFAPFKFVNARNVASEIDESLTSHVKGTFVDVEQLLLWNPDYIFVDEAGYNLVNEDFRRLAPLKSLKAFKNNEVHVLLPYNNYATNYENVLINAWYIGKVLYPESFAEVDLETKGSEILSFFYNRELSLDSIMSSLSLQKMNISVYE